METKAAQSRPLAGRVAVVTGAAGDPGLGRSHALHLAALGARLVVNDYGCGSDGRSSTHCDPADVVREIAAGGGEAIVSTHSVAERDSAQAIVAAALEEWGRLDILVNNAGVAHFALFEMLSAHDIRAMIDVHLMGTIWMCQAAWPHMRRQGFGRVVNTVSGAVLGARYASVYGAAKGGILSLTRNLAIEGAEHDIKVNALAPGALTKAINELSPRQAEALAATGDAWSPDRVSPLVGILSRPDCPYSGKCLGAESNRVFETYFVQTPGYRYNQADAGDLALNLPQVLDRSAAVAVADPVDGAAGFTLSPRPYVAG